MESTKHVPTPRLSRGVSVREFAEINGISRSTVNRGIYDGSIPSYKIGGTRRIPLGYLEQLQQPDPVDTAIAQIVAAAPPLTADQRSKISALLRMGDEEREDVTGNTSARSA